jgi:hypothetical protein
MEYSEYDDPPNPNNIGKGSHLFQWIFTNKCESEYVGGADSG